VNHELSPLVILLALVLVGCEPETRPREVAASSTLVEESTNYADPTEQQQFKEALKNAGVAHVIKMRDGKEYISWKASEHEAVARIEASLFGPPLPSGRHLSAGAQRQGEFKAWLTANEIPFTTQVSRGREYVVWGEEYTQKVNNSPFFSPAMQSPNPSFEGTASGLRPPAAPQVKR
jgi:hypothetical protein